MSKTFPKIELRAIPLYLQESEEIPFLPLDIGITVLKPNSSGTEPCINRPENNNEMCT